MTAYLEFAELQALNRKPMYMKDWSSRLDDFLRMAGNDVLDNAGKISHEKAIEKASSEYQRFRDRHINDISEVERHFIDSLENARKKLVAKDRRDQ